MRYYYPNEYKAIFKLGIPISIGQIGLTLQNLADNIMVGQHSTEELAAAGFVNNMFLMALLLTFGFSIGSVSQIGALFSQGKTSHIVRVFKSSVIVDFLQGCLMTVGLVILYFCLPYMGQPDELLPLMKPYLMLQLVSLPIMAVINAFRQLTDSINDTVVGMMIMLVGNVCNIVLNWLLIFGNWGFPELGIVGAAWATLASRVLMLLVYIYVFFSTHRYHKYSKHWHATLISRKDLALLNRLGWPISLQMGMESASFAVVAVFLGWIGTNALAAHQVMINIANVLFMTYVGVSNAVAIRVSNHNGLGNMLAVRHATFAGYEMILALSIILSSVAFIYRHEVSYLFTDNSEVASIVATLAYPLVLYQFGDGLQLIFANGLRGLGDVKKLMKYSFVAYVLVSLPISYILGIWMNWGTFGIWMAFPFGLTLAGLLYIKRFLNVTSTQQHSLAL